MPRRGVSQVPRHEKHFERSIFRRPRICMSLMIDRELSNSSTENDGTLKSSRIVE